MEIPGDLYRLVLRGPLSASAADLVDQRFGPAARVVVEVPDSVLEVSADQAALRALLGLLWDCGHEVVAVTRAPAR